MKILRYAKGLIWLISPNVYHRRRARQELVAMFGKAMGDFVVLDDHLLWRDDKEFREKFRSLSPENRFSEPRKWVLREYAKLVSGLSGDAAECGTYRGTGAYFICQALPETKVHLFDSFEGLSPPSGEDVAASVGTSYWSEGDLTVTLEEARQTLADFPHVHFYKGWIPDRFPEVENRRFKLIHIDVDLYRPTLDSIEFFWPRMVPGGVMIFDDYGFSNCPGANKAVNEFFANERAYVLHLPTGQGVVTKPSD